MNNLPQDDKSFIQDMGMSQVPQNNFNYNQNTNSSNVHTLTIGPEKQVFDLNGASNYFSINVTAQSRDNTPFMAVIASQNMIERQSDSLEFQNVTDGIFSGDITYDRGPHQSFFLVLKTTDKNIDGIPIDISLVKREISNNQLPHVPAVTTEPKKVTTHRPVVDKMRDPPPPPKRRKFKWLLIFIIIIVILIAGWYFFGRKKMKGLKKGNKSNIDNVGAIPDVDNVLSPPENLPNINVTDNIPKSGKDIDSLLSKLEKM